MDNPENLAPNDTKDEKKNQKTSIHLLETTTRKTYTNNVNNAPEEEIRCTILYIKPHEILHSHRNINRDQTQATLRDERCNKICDCKINIIFTAV